MYICSWDAFKRIRKNFEFSLILQFLENYDSAKECNTDGATSFRINLTRVAFISISLLRGMLNKFEKISFDFPNSRDSRVITVHL